MKHLPIFLDIKDRPALVVGGGLMAARKVESLLGAGARVTVVAEDAAPDLEAFFDDDRLSHVARPFEDDDLEDKVLAIVATDDDVLNRRVSALARKSGVPVNVVDNFELCTFIMPAIVDRSPIVVAVSSGGEAPILARLLKTRLESIIPGAFGRLARFAGACRERVRSAIADADARRHFFERLVEGPIAEYVLAGQNEAAEELLAKTLEQAAGQSADVGSGEVYLVGSGPGDPDLLTFRALRLMQQADVVLHDRLVPDAILELVRRDAERVFVGKRRGDHALPQEEISALMVRLARDGKRVLRLKGGDPFVFGRGGEEIDMLAAEGIHFQVVPGVTAASGCATYAGIPLTHRDHAQSCVFVTGHTKDDTLDLNWQTLTQPNQTVVVYMGLNSIDILSREMIAHGADPATPAAVIDNGTREDQRVVSAALSDIATHAEEAELAGPAVIVIGGVVTLRDKLSWFKPTYPEGGTGSTAYRGGGEAQAGD